ncbi:hypothetical protein J5N97_027238 [Dioscorea zingiberensis]|uniref:Late embryogenesis abundant protein LEA-2 subgroup domain-containing protein n=1 Tax=Dioscorea zingiberensis TaxID=325984 RepID=A0A9D5C4G5_9LILI|nr:hypothetical protein J5N97_027238 [Dioscorea zingiberensis]
MTEGGGGCCRCCTKLVLGLGLTTLILYLTYHPIRPRFFITAFSLTSGNLTATYSLEIENKNRQIAVLHDPITLSVSLPPGNLTAFADPIAAFHQGHAKTADFDGSVSLPAGTWTSAVANVSAVVRVSVSSAFRYKVLAWKTRHHTVDVGGDVAVDKEGRKIAEKGIRLSSASLTPLSAFLVLLPAALLVLLIKD